MTHGSVFDCHVIMSGSKKKKKRRILQAHQSGECMPPSLEEIRMDDSSFETYLQVDSGSR